MRQARRRRHQQLAVDELVARRLQRVRVDECTHLCGGPAAAFHGGHAHMMLGSAKERQESTPYNRCTAGTPRYQTRADGTETPRKRPSPVRRAPRETEVPCCAPRP